MVKAIENLEILAEEYLSKNVLKAEDKTIIENFLTSLHPH